MTAQTPGQIVVAPRISARIERPHSVNAKDLATRLRMPLSESMATLIPQDRTEQISMVAHRTNVLSVFLKVKKADKRQKECQDTAFALIDKEYVLIVVADGFNTFGHLYSETAGLALMRMVNSRKDSLGSFVLADAIAEVDDKVTSALEASAGTTLVAALVFPDGRYQTAMLGDSEPFLIDPNGSSRRAIQHEDYVNSLEIGQPIRARYAQVSDYLKFRDVIDGCISHNNQPHSNDGKILSERGKLVRGQTLALVSDGITKNLWVYAKKGMMADISGCEDFSQIVSRIDIDTPLDIAGSMIMDKIAERIEIARDLDVRIQQEDVRRGDETITRVLAPSDDDRTLAAITML